MYDEYTRSDHTLMRFVTGYPASASPAARCAFLAAELGMQGPADPDRTYAVGQFMPREWMLQVCASLSLQQCMV